jgi:hypothetical protein
MSALFSGRSLPPPQPTVNYLQGMPANLGAMKNLDVGCCTSAAYYHARQVWSFNANPPIDTQPDPEVVALYEATGGYVPGNPSTDQGAIEQDVLSYLLNTGAPLANGSRAKLAAFFEVDTRNIDDVKRVIAACGVAYIGAEIPASIMAGTPPKLWDATARETDIAGGHAVVLAGYDADTATFISWGDQYRMSWNWFSLYVDEVYALIDPEFVERTGLTPAGIDLKTLEGQMEAIRA